ncbi:MAG TPA: T9SS type A sorting domain-containing protein, partial [Cytophagaceae bacterium]|nr:T9SS type A sorting domain-containing protein [Cytophagaceae bacterium]
DSLNNMTVNNTAGVTINSATYVKKYLTLTAGTVTTGGNLTVDLYFGAILGTGTGSVSGNITVVRTIWNYNWHYISSPLSGRTVADWNAIIPIKFGVNANLYTYDETNPSTNKAIGWTAVAGMGTVITSMKGYSLYFPRWIYKTNFSMTGAYTHSQTYSNAGLTNTSSGVSTSDGWNLVGNPYPSEIDWDAVSGWTKTGLDNAIYFWDQANNRYASYVSSVGSNGGTRYIPCMQGFYVRVTNPGTGTLAMTNSVRSSVINRDNWRISSQDLLIRLNAITGAYSDETVIRLTDLATDNFDSQLDAYKLPSSGSTPNLSTSLANADYSINSISSNTIEKTIPVKLIAGLTGTYTITADITGLNNTDSIILEDKLLGISQDLISKPSYSVGLTSGDTTSRFYLHYKSSASIITDNTNALGNSELDITAYQQKVSITFPDQNSGTSNIYVYDMIGNKVYVLENADTSSGKVEFNLPNVSSAVYIVKVQSNALNKTQQVYLSK